jgi:hypothetical protein
MNAAQSWLNNTTNASIAFDAFITKITPSGSALVYSTFLGGTNNDRAFGLTLDSDANVYVTGSSLSCDFPRTSTNLASAVIRNNHPDVFVTKLSADRTSGFIPFSLAVTVQTKAGPWLWIQSAMPTSSETLRR